MSMESNFGPVPKTEEETQESVVAPVEKKKYTPLTPEEEGRAKFELDENELDNWIKKHPNEDVPMEMRLDHKEGKAEVERLIEEFKQNHSLETLQAMEEITPEFLDIFIHIDREREPEKIPPALAKLSPEDAEKYKIRTAAQDNYSLIGKTLKNLQKKTTIREEEYDKLDAERKLLMLAIGRINGDKILHTLH